MHNIVIPNNDMNNKITYYYNIFDIPENLPTTLSKIGEYNITAAGNYIISLGLSYYYTAGIGCAIGTHGGNLSEPYAVYAKSYDSNKCTFVRRFNNEVTIDLFGYWASAQSQFEYYELMIIRII